MKKQTLTLLLGLCASSGAFAANVTISGTIPGTVVHQQTGIRSQVGTFNTAAPQVQVIQYEKVILSPEAKKYLAEHAVPSAKRRLLGAANNSVAQTQLGMNQVPVLNQGMHGTCATFATTAALDAVLGHDDHISQLCNLELGSTLAKKNADYPSGWDGSNNDIILSQIKQYGAISKDYQTKYGCAGVRTYPLNQENKTGRPMKIDDFTRHSEKVMTNISYKELLSMDNAFSNSAQNDDNTKLDNVKKALINGHRVVFGMLLDEGIGNNGTAGQYKVKFDSWVNTPEIQKQANTTQGLTAGHAMVITGFDDNAVITDVHNVKHTGVFTLRNSWGADTGDNGSYYMSYDYLTAYVMELKEILPNA